MAELQKIDITKIDDDTKLLSKIEAEIADWQDSTKVPTLISEQKAKFQRLVDGGLSKDMHRETYRQIWLMEHLPDKYVENRLKPLQARKLELVAVKPTEGIKNV